MASYRIFDKPLAETMVTRIFASPGGINEKMHSQVQFRSLGEGKQRNFDIW